MRSFLTAIPVAFFAAWLAVFRVTTIALASLLLILATGSFSQSAFAQSKCDCWINSKTGEAVRSYPYHSDSDPDDPNPKTAFRPSTGDNFFRDQDCTWRNSKTGEAVRSYPYHSDSDPDDPNPKTAFRPSTGDNFSRVVPCPPPSVTTIPPTPTPTPKEKKVETCDLEFGYDYMRAPDESAKNLNGFGGSLFCNVKPWIAVGGDFGALFGSTTDTVGTTKFDVSLHRQTYLFGPQFNFYPNDKVKIFVHPLLGGVHDTTKTTIGTTTTTFSANAFAMAFGGGVDVNLNNNFAFRPIQFDYVPTHFGGAWQSNYRISTGLVIRFGGKK